MTTKAKAMIFPNKRAVCTIMILLDVTHVSRRQTDRFCCSPYIFTSSPYITSPPRRTSSMASPPFVVHHCHTIALLSIPFIPLRLRREFLVIGLVFYVLMDMELEFPYHSMFAARFERWLAAVWVGDVIFWCLGVTNPQDLGDQTEGGLSGCAQIKSPDFWEWIREQSWKAFHHSDSLMSEAILFLPMGEMLAFYIQWVMYLWG